MSKRPATTTTIHQRRRQELDELDQLQQQQQLQQPPQAIAIVQPQLTPIPIANLSEPSPVATSPGSQASVYSTASQTSTISNYSSAASGLATTPNLQTIKGPTQVSSTLFNATQPQPVTVHVPASPAGIHQRSAVPAYHRQQHHRRRSASGRHSEPPEAESSPPQQQQHQNQLNEDYKLLLTPMFAAMTRITDNLFLTGVGGMTRDNFQRNHIDFVVNITLDAPFYENVESMRLPLEDDSSANILSHLDTACDKIHEQVSRNKHVLVHCVAGVSRSATVVIAYLMKYKHIDLRTAFNYCYNLRPVIRPNNGFMMQLINYEHQLFGRTSVHMVDAEVDGVLINLPHFFLEEHPQLVLLEVMRAKDSQNRPSASA